MNPYRLPDPLLEHLLADDVPCGDATTFALGLDRQPVMLFRGRKIVLEILQVDGQQCMAFGMLGKLRHQIEQHGVRLI